MTGPPEPASEPAARALTDEEHDDARRRTARRVGLVGLAVAVALTLLSGLAGVPGAFAGALLVLLLALASGVTGTVLAVGLAVDQLRGRRVSLRRALLTGVYALATVVLLVASSGALVAAAGEP